MVAPADYEYDIFLSYERKPPIEDWVHKHFYPELEQRLYVSSTKQIKIFIDQDIKPPANWAAKISRALLRSRYMIAVLTPRYFTTSEWCRAEWHTMQQREKLLGLGEKGLIFGVDFNGPEGHVNLPRDATQRQLSDFSAWNVPGEYFKTTAHYPEFAKEVEKLAKQIVAALPEAPRFNPKWKAKLPGPPASKPDFKKPRI